MAISTFFNFFDIVGLDAFTRAKHLGMTLRRNFLIGLGEEFVPDSEITERVGNQLYE